MDKINQYEVILRALQSARYVSGSALAESLAVSRTVVNRRLHELGDMGLRIHAVTGKGYHLDTQASLLQQDDIVLPASFQFVRHLITGSTNDDVLSMARVSSRPLVVTTEYQSTGKGRRGRQWNNAFGQDLAVSIGFPIAGVEGLKPYSVIAGVAVAKALSALPWLPRVGVKWPNDLYIDNAKLGGILTELHTLPQGQAYVVIGLGLNVNRRDFEGIDQQATSLCMVRGNSVDRTAVLQTILDAITGLVETGFDADWQAAWQTHDVLFGKNISVLTGNNTLQGTAEGVALDGSLMVRSAAGLIAVNGGEVSVRAR
ncbi:biotin--[acetyl-CoA-carboxylase] ligase [Salinispirillum sp. LH 10-3-1]|uniref:Bifunctional ligase/repressor BirA n=1 Tax=Salinispirillum sp. LH 10-3-1 TaxID=2952525 RepID=A0AB38YEM2_9GAMM